MTCSRLFEAEATRDGRLTGAERASFERHAQVCAVCAREIAELDALAETLRRSDAEPGDELHEHREKRRLLAAFDRGLLAPQRSSVLPWRWLGAAAAVALLAIGLRGWKMRSDGARLDADGPRAVVHADAETAWSKRLESTRELIVLEHGKLWVQVAHRASARNVVVALPDGELEDVGTTFTVSVTDGHTARVAVQEGRVMLRLRNQASVTIEAGHEWTAPPVRPQLAASASALPLPSTDSRLPAPSLANTAAASGAGAPASSAHVSDAATDFRVATAALNRGDNAEAAKDFARFWQLHPRDPRAEDAAYLRVIALQRSGNRAEMSKAVADFLRHYPSGFRRTEVQGLLRQEL